MTNMQTNTQSPLQTLTQVPETPTQLQEISPLITQTNSTPSFFQVSPELLPLVHDIKKSINVSDTTSLLTFGSPAQQSLVSFTDTLLSKVKAKDAAVVGKSLEALMGQLNSIDLQHIKKAQSFWGKLPILGYWAKQGVKALIGDLESIKSKINQLVDQLKTQEQSLLKDITMFDGFYLENIEYIKRVEAYIVAGNEKLLEFQDQLITLEHKHRQTQDPLDAQNYRDLSNNIELFSKRVHNLVLTRHAAIQTSVNVRVAQEADKILVNDINDILNNTMMIWKSQFVIAIGLMHTEKALQSSKSVKDFTNAQYLANAQTLNQLVDSLKENYERGILDISTLEEVNKLTINSVQKSIQMYQEAQSKRINAQNQLTQMEADIKGALLSASQQPNSFPNDKSG